MSKKKAHLFHTRDLARSVLLGVPVTAVCGFKRTWEREDFEGPKPADGCGRCVAAVAGERHDKEVTFRREPTWLEILETACLENLTVRPAISVWFNTTTANGTATYRYPPAT